jgi:hypothetical protein
MCRNKKVPHCELVGTPHLPVANVSDREFSCMVADAARNRNRFSMFSTPAPSLDELLRRGPFGAFCFGHTRKAGPRASGSIDFGDVEDGVGDLDLLAELVTRCANASRGKPDKASSALRRFQGGFVTYIAVRCHRFKVP